MVIFDYNMSSGEYCAKFSLNDECTFMTVKTKLYLYNYEVMYISYQQGYAII